LIILLGPVSNRALMPHQAVVLMWKTILDVTSDEMILLMMVESEGNGGCDISAATLRV